MNIRNQAIVANIKDIATMRRTTIKQIEKDLGFGNGMIGKWKSAPKSPPFEKIEMIAEYLGVTVDDLTSTQILRQNTQSCGLLRKQRSAWMTLWQA